MLRAEVLQAMAAAGATMEMVIAAVSADQAADAALRAEKLAEKRAGAADRQRRKREKDKAEEAANVTPVTRDSALHGVTERDNPSLNDTQSNSKPSEGNLNLTPAPLKSPRPFRSVVRLLPDDWAVDQKHRDRLKARGATDQLIDHAADALRSWARSKAVKRADWDATHEGFVLRDLKQHATGPPNGLFANHGHANGGSNGKDKSLQSFARAQHERACAADEERAKMLAELRDAEDGDAPRLLSTGRGG